MTMNSKTLMLAAVAALSLGTERVNDFDTPGFGI
jgi:hypothetical protein